MRRQNGSSLIEVLVTISILAFGMLGLGAMQARIQVMNLESFQRGQAVVLLSDMVDRIIADRPNAASFLGDDGSGNYAVRVVGTGDAYATTCSASAVGAPRNLCEWSNLLKGAAEKSAGSPIGAMAGARGCISRFTEATGSFGQCQTGIQVDVVWQGMSPTFAPTVTCGQGLYGSRDSFRRAISTRIGTGLAAC